MKPSYTEASGKQKRRAKINWKIVLWQQSAANTNTIKLYIPVGGRVSDQTEWTKLVFCVFAKIENSCKCQNQ